VEWSPTADPVLVTRRKAYRWRPGSEPVLIVDEPGSFRAVSPEGVTAIATERGLELIGADDTMVVELRSHAPGAAAFSPDGELAALWHEERRYTLSIGRTTEQLVLAPAGEADAHRASVAWWHDSVVVDGPAIRFHDGATAALLAECRLIDATVGDLVWTAPPDQPGQPDWISTNRTDAINVYQPRRHNRPRVIDDPAERQRFLESVEGTDVIGGRLAFWAGGA
ncbi:MAG: hypothetical protein HKN26_04035, partial [Acidimicrobiales bacterium]|nr:hypothetical protein [Acidimicrobiales bacterium]